LINRDDRIRLGINTVEGKNNGLVLLILSAFAKDIGVVIAIEAAASVFILMGGVLLRYSVVMSGVRLVAR
jgi:hypothetical protein